MGLEIAEIEVLEFTYRVEDANVNRSRRKLIYEPGHMLERSAYAVRIRTDDGPAGEYVGGNGPAMAQITTVADSLIGRDALARERHWHELRQALRMHDQTGIGPVDIALWDIAGKHYGAPIHELLGTYRKQLPAYVSSYFGSESGGFDSPEAIADFAAQCRELGYPAFKAHAWSGVANRDVSREVATVRAVGKRIGDEMDLMYDPTCEYETFADALKVGRACDEQGYLWYEDPYADGGRSQHGHRKLRQLLNTPLLVTELVRGVEPHADFIAAEATDFVRADPEWDGGITGAMKIARTAEAFGLDVEYHLAGPARRHCMAATRNSNYYELGLVHSDSGLPHTQPPVYRGEYTDDMQAVDESGTFPVPDDPGLGVKYDWELIEANSTDRTVYR